MIDIDPEAEIHVHVEEGRVTASLPLAGSPGQEWSMPADRPVRPAFKPQLHSRTIRHTRPGSIQAGRPCNPVDGHRGRASGAACRT